MKHEWRKKEKLLYIPKLEPSILTIPSFNFFTIKGQGAPNSNEFYNCITALYTLSYGIKMNLKKNPVLKDYYDYTVYPLEGIWDISKQAKNTYTKNSKLNKNDLVYTLMIRQPNFINKEYALNLIETTKQKKKNIPIHKVNFESIAEGKCIQMLHIGSFDNEAKSFNSMEKHAKLHHLTRVSKIHKEIYLSDFRRVSTDKLKTVLRFNVK